VSAFKDRQIGVKMMKIKHFRLATKSQWGKRGEEQHNSCKKKQYYRNVLQKEQQQGFQRGPPP
jgi:hypothetical protein